MNRMWLLLLCVKIGINIESVTERFINKMLINMLTDDPVIVNVLKVILSFETC